MKPTAIIFMFLLILILFFLISEFFGRRKHIGRWWSFVLLMGGLIPGLIALIFSPSAQKQPTKGNIYHVLFGWVSIILLGFIGLIPSIVLFADGHRNVNGYPIAFILLGFYLLRLGKGKVVNKNPKYYFSKTEESQNKMSFEKQIEVLEKLKNDGILTLDEFNLKVNNVQNYAMSFNQKKEQEKITEEVNKRIEPILKNLNDLVNANLLTNDEFEIKKSELIQTYTEKIQNDAMLKKTEINDIANNDDFNELTKKKAKYIVFGITSLFLILFSIGTVIYINYSDEPIVCLNSEPTFDLDGNIYPTIKIERQIWLAKNLNVSHFRNGDSIQEVRTDEEWKNAELEQRPAWCYYNNNPLNGEIYGKLYNFYAVQDPRGLAPMGWHIPSSNEWKILVKNLSTKSEYVWNYFDYTKGESVVGSKLRYNKLWNNSYSTVNESGFNALPAGYRFSREINNKNDSAFNSLGTDAYWWLSSTSGWGGEYVCIYGWGINTYLNNTNFEGDGKSIRCLKNED